MLFALFMYLLSSDFIFNFQLEVLVKKIDEDNYCTRHDHFSQGPYLGFI